MRVAIIGAGLQCRRRAPVLRESPETELVAIASLHRAHAEAIAKGLGCEATDDWHAVVERRDVDAIVVCTPPHVHAEMTIMALRAGKHVLCEKPLARTLAESEAMLAAARESGRVLKCGFNHRHHPAIRDAKRLVDEGRIGRPVFGRCRYGLCGRPEYEKEWRADPAQAAGGQFIEQGTHGIDLFRWFLGEVVEVTGMTSTGYFTGQPLEDNGMALFRFQSGATAMLHTSLTQWKNLFSFEIFGTDGYLEVEGLGTSYGTERLIVGRRDFDAPFHDGITEYRGGDVSWRDEWREFLGAVRERREPLGNGADGLAAMRVALATYQAERSGALTKLA
ncbi:MAG: Gfo/Idh/MocA family oxidoreductase [Candidatus Rokubacteria bacterium]|nr:Gfo/Idh/MocA family oxidoreductase [Candidatus Rokubacteria bacterium]